MAFQIKVNGRVRAVHTDSDTPLLWVLRDHPGLTGTKFHAGWRAGQGMSGGLLPGAVALRSAAPGRAGVR
ncbi:MAG: hypothetical protein ACXU9A_25245 [Xanthobacteraceae bacterium]